MNIPRIALLLALLAAPTLRAQAPCDCLDQADLKKRMALVTEAMMAFTREFQVLYATPYTPKIRKDLADRVDAAMTKVSLTQGLRVFASGGTDELCQIHVLRAPTNCMAEGIRRHEQVHQKACEKTRNRVVPLIAGGKAKDRFDAMGVTMAYYIQEELEGYSVEMQFLQSELQRLQLICKPAVIPGRDYSSRPTQMDHGSPAPNDAPGASTAPPPVKGPRPLKGPAPIKAPPMPKPAPMPRPSDG